MMAGDRERLQKPLPLLNIAVVHSDQRVHLFDP